jgi:hypothetical protein
MPTPNNGNGNKIPAEMQRLSVGHFVSDRIHNWLSLAGKVIHGAYDNTPLFQLQSDQNVQCSTEARSDRVMIRLNVNCTDNPAITLSEISWKHFEKCGDDFLRPLQQYSRGSDRWEEIKKGDNEVEQKGHWCVVLNKNGVFLIARGIRNGSGDESNPYAKIEHATMAVVKIGGMAEPTMQVRYLGMNIPFETEEKIVNCITIALAKGRNGTGACCAACGKLIP